MLSIKKLETTWSALVRWLLSEKINRRTVWHGMERDLSVGILEKTMPIENVFATETNCSRFIAVKFTDL